MEQYISKSTLIAEIERRKSQLQTRITELGNFESNTLGLFQEVDLYDDIISFLDTLEVKEADSESHINCKVGWYDGMFLDYTQEQLSTLLDKIGANVGDEVKIYITK